MQKLDFTGERFHPEVKGDIESEHLHRYYFAIPFVKDKVVLDIACGEGYGSHLLSKTASTVLGVDIAESAVNHAKNRYRNSALDFKVGSCSAIPTPSGQFEVITSFETIEHHEQHEEMMLECVRVLRPNGLLIISSPDRQNYSVEPSYSNPFHVKELFEHEFRLLLAKYFRYITFFAQRQVYGSAIVCNDTAGSTEFLNISQDQLQTSFQLHKPLYWIAIASNSPIQSPPTASIFEYPITLSNSYQAAANRANELEEALNQEKANAVAQITFRDDLVSQYKEQLSNTLQEASRIRLEVLAAAEKMRSEVLSAAEQQRYELEANAVTKEQELGQEIARLKDELSKKVSTINSITRSSAEREAQLLAELQQHVRLVEEARATSERISSELTDVLSKYDFMNRAHLSRHEELAFELSNLQTQLGETKLILNNRWKLLSKAIDFRK